MKIVFMGTPDFAVPCLDALVKAGHRIEAVFTQPDRPKNRGHKLQMPPIKEYALENNIPVYQPASLRKGEDAEASLEELRSIAPDCIVVAAYGQILPKAVLDLPKYGCINIHASLLPRYRGAAPINRCIMNGEKESGVTIMHMAEGLDTGDMIISETVPISDEMTASQLHDILAQAGGKLIVKALSMIEDGTAPRIPQTDENTCYAAMLTKEECRIDFNDTADNIYNKIRGLSQSPCAYTMLDGKRLKVYFAQKLDISVNAPAGTVTEGEGLCVACKSGALRLTDIQPEGGKRMKDSDFLRGRKIPAGTLLG